MHANSLLRLTRSTRSPIGIPEMANITPKANPFSIPNWLSLRPNSLRTGSATSDNTARSRK